MPSSVSTHNILFSPIFKLCSVGIMRSGASNWETKKVEMMAKIGPKFPGWLESFMQAAQGNAKYNKDNVFNVQRLRFLAVEGRHDPHGREREPLQRSLRRRSVVVR